MGFFHTYNGKTLAYDRDLSASLLTLSFTIGLSGSVSGYATLDGDSGIDGYMAGVKENSHFLKLGLNKVYGAVVESAVKDRGVWRVDFIGAMEYFEKMDAVAAHKAGVSHGVAGSGDYSWVKVLYSDSVSGVLYEALRNLSDSMTARGYSASLLDYSSLRSAVSSNTNPDWGRSYRLNSLETPTMKTLVEDIVGDTGMELFRIRVSSTIVENFRFIFEVVSSASAVTLSEATDSVFDVVVDSAKAERRSWSVAKGTDLNDNSVVERVPFDGNVAYSSLISTAPQERSNAVARFAQTQADAAGASSVILTFTSYLDSLDPLDFVTVSSARMPTYSGIVTEKNIEGSKITYKVQVGSAASFNAVLQKPSDELRKIIFHPLGKTSELAIRSAGQKPNATGWRT